MTHRNVLAQLIQLSKFSSPSSTTFNDIIRLTLTAFEQKKPLFEADEKESAVDALMKSFHLLEPAYRQLDVGMNEDRRQDAQMSLSGLQYIVDEMQGVPELYKKLEELITSPHIKSIEKYIENTVGILPENVAFKTINLAKIPPSHYWWFYPEDDESE